MIRLVAGLATASLLTACSSSPPADPTPAALDPALVAGAQAYLGWVEGEVAALGTLTGEFAALIAAGDTAAAQAIYPRARTHWERIEPVAESFGDLDPRMDAREGDLPADQEWTGWHRLEKDLWIDGLQADSTAVAARLVVDTADLAARVAELELRPDQVTDGAKGLLDEVASTKITGEEERYSRTDLWDIEANVDGAEQAFLVFAAVVRQRDPDLAATLEREFAAMAAALDPFRTGAGFVPYTALTPSQVRELSQQVESLAEPVAALSAVLV
jgi:iron uptake system component EfeO